MTYARQYETRYIDETTGEITTQKSNRIIYIDGERGYLFFLNRNKVISFEGFDLPSDLSNLEAGMMYRLAKRTHHTSNLISYRSNGQTKPATIKSICKYLGLPERRGRLFLNKMIKLRIIGRINVKIGTETTIQYYINPIYFMNGKWLSANLYFLFQKDLDDFLPQYAKDFFQNLGDKQEKVDNPQGIEIKHDEKSSN